MSVYEKQYLGCLKMATYTLEDIIQAEVRKAISRKVGDEPVEPSGGLGGLDIGQITRLLTEVNKLISNVSKNRQDVILQEGSVATRALPEAQKSGKSSAEMYEKLLAGLDALAESAGEMTVRELRDYAKENREEVIKLIEGFT